MAPILKNSRHLAAANSLAVIKMKKIYVVFFLQFLTQNIIGQHVVCYHDGRKIIHFGYFGPKDLGNKKIEKNNSSIVLFSDSSKLTIKSSDICKVTRWINFSPKKTQSISLQVSNDSILVLLFNKGLVTPNLLLNAYNSEPIRIEHNGDTIFFTDKLILNRLIFNDLEIYEHSKTMSNQYFLTIAIRLLNTRFDSPRYYENTGVIQNIHNSGDLLFEILLKSTLKATPENIVEFINLSELLEVTFWGNSIWL